MSNLTKGPMVHPCEVLREDFMPDYGSNSLWLGERAKCGT